MKRFSLRSTWHPFVAIAVTVAPGTKHLQPVGWRDLRELVEDTLNDRPLALQRQIKLFIHLVNFAPVFFYGRTLTHLSETNRTAFLRQIEQSRIEILRKGFWGLRTLILMGYYGQERTGDAIGYAARAGGWSASR